MTERELLVLAGAGLIVVLALSAMYGMHERHYRSRAERIQAARDSGHIEDRLVCLEHILAEDRLT